jgi:hypothetical protein
LLPEESGRGDWSSVWWRGASGDEATLDLGQNRAEQMDQKERQSKRKSLGEEGVRGSFMPRRNRRRRAAVSAGFHQEIRRLEAVFAREKWRVSQLSKTKKFLRIRTRKPRYNLGDVINERDRWDLHTLEEIAQR